MFITLTWPMFYSFRNMWIVEYRVYRNVPLLLVLQIDFMERTFSESSPSVSAVKMMNAYTIQFGFTKIKKFILVVKADQP